MWIYWEHEKYVALKENIFAMEMGHSFYEKMNKGYLVEQRNTGSPNKLIGTIWHKPILS